MERLGQPSAPWRVAKKAIASNWRESVLNSWEAANSKYRPGTNVLHRYLKRDLDDLGAIVLSIKAEQEAISFYQQSSQQAKWADLKRILLSLLEFEEGHRRLLESEYPARLGQPWNDYELDRWVRE